MKRNLHIAGMSSFYDIGICQYPKDNPLGSPWPIQVATIILRTGSVDIDALMKLSFFYWQRSSFSDHLHNI